ncbi:DNA gyrase subunit A [Listeria monocytogenes]|jgi:DNA gyrase subunit A (EC 5.99.1.3)|uniref:DNA gyrase subunit A n=14 Tax=Listeria monocytogenes TaxID=1639 RepID=Q8YAV6_LISMO|nr:DNA gyrase subunit A [Listeria monocytogenes]NP_463540.1 DNA gyrase subunit A [Listeria monocytogenes EGD-e]EAA0165289.1 DNA gyrase subunit A [Listeria monocytogenes serotype 1/2a]EAD3235613.1 DNA gyrase subunit A [Listeria monocytogenes CFSAN002202]EAE3702947.1 DNA gyrase subunit A [Listeria monocytogenes serotype 1/2c]EAE6021290.1 DNA gyrase subunit A [Listeria monocytogenes serotype 3a]EAF4501207.1 DNA gyrase subunit A [Listeria monocytogenes serotype 4b]EAG6256427.1 DNA gyrase subunit
MAETPNQRITEINLNKEMRTSFLDYAMSVIVARALPDVRDGLKPVHRRILYAMNDLGMTSDKAYKKSARIVGEVIGKYHPHGDTAVYFTMVRMAQDFSYRNMLVDGHGNFGSVDGDMAAAMRYTEARMSKISMELLRDINKDTIDYADNYDGSEREPVILPARFPNLLVNGSSGIAVGMATNIPTHHLGEVIDGVLALSHDPEITIRDLMEYIPGPDFPTAGMIMGRSGIRRAYESGRGSITVRGRVDIEEKKNGKETIVITEIPYQVNKARLVERIAELAREKKIDGITSLNDESDRSGMRIVIEVRRDISASVIVNNLFKMTALQTTFGINMLALVDNHPKVLNLKEILYYYLEHQKVVIRRRTEFELRKAEARAHILEGLRIALDNIDAIIKLIRGSKTSDVAKEGLMTQFNLSDKQAQAILDMRLQRLTGLEREKIEEEYQNLVALINDLKAILADDERILEIIREELEEIKVKYADKRRTEILAGDLVSLEDEDLIPEEEVAITLTKRGYIKRLPLSTYRSQRRGGRGIQGMSTHEDDFVEHLVATSTHDTLLFFTNTGKVYRSKGYEVPEYGRTAKGIPIINLLGIESQEQVNAVINLSEFTDDSYLFFTTKHGVVKRTTLSQFAKIRQSGLRAVELRENDELISVQMTDGSKNMIIATKHGQSIYFPEENIRVMGRTAAGVRGIRLREDDEVIGMEVLEDDEKVLVVTEKGYGKQTPASQYPLRNRGGMGVKTVTITEKNGNLVAMKTVTGEEDLMLMTVSGVLIRFEIDTVSQTGRSAMGVKLIRLDEDEKVATVAKVPKEEDEVELEEEIDETLITQVPDESFEDAPGSDIEE